MHIGFSFKPKTLLIILVAILGIVGLCVDAFADPLPEDGTAQLLTDETDPTGTTETPASTVVINAAPAAEAAAPETYTYQRGEHTGLAASVKSIFGEYQPLMATTVPVMCLLSPASPVLTSVGSEAAWHS